MTMELMPASSVNTTCRQHSRAPICRMRRAGEIDDRDAGIVTRSLVIGASAFRPPASHVRIEPRFFQNLARDLYRDRQRQDRAGMRLHDHAIAGSKAGEQRRIAVPGRECGAADDERDAARHDAPGLVEHVDRLALRLFPIHSRHAVHLVIGIGNRFQRALLRMRAASLKRHHESLARRMHHGIGDQEALLVDALDDFEAIPARSSIVARPDLARLLEAKALSTAAKDK